MKTETDVQYVAALILKVLNEFPDIMTAFILVNKEKTEGKVVFTNVSNAGCFLLIRETLEKEIAKRNGGEPDVTVGMSEVVEEEE